MSEREGTAEDFAKMAAAARGQDDPTTKQEANRRLVESVHPPESDPEPDEGAVEEQQFIERLFAPKPGYAELVRRLHRDESEEA